MGPAKCVPSTSTRTAGVAREEALPRRLRLRLVEVRAAAPIRMRDLHRVVHQVAGDHGLLAARADVHADVAGRVPGRRLEPHLVGHRVVVGDEVDEAGVEHRPHRLGEHGAVRRRRLAVSQCSYSRRLHRYRAFGKVGTQRPFSQPRVPADVVDVQVGAEHGVDRLGREAGGGEIREEAALALVPGRNRQLLVVADAGVHHDAAPLRLHHEGVHAHQRVAPSRRRSGAAARRRAAGSRGSRRAGSRSPSRSAPARRAWSPPRPRPASAAFRFPASGGYPTPSFARGAEAGRDRSDDRMGEGERTVVRSPRCGRPDQRSARAVAARLPRARLLVAPPAPAVREARLPRLGAEPARLREVVEAEGRGELSHRRAGRGRRGPDRRLGRAQRHAGGPRLGRARGVGVRGAPRAAARAARDHERPAPGALSRRAREQSGAAPALALCGVLPAAVAARVVLPPQGRGRDRGGVPRHGDRQEPLPRRRARRVQAERPPAGRRSPRC